MTKRTAGRLAWALAALAVGLVAAAVGFMLVDRGQTTLDFNGPYFAAAILAFAVLGALLASRRANNPMGWIFLAAAALFAINIFADRYAHYGLVKNPGSVPGADIGSWLVIWEWPAGTALILVYSLLLFPDGHPPSRRWRPVAWVAGVAIVLAAVPSAIKGWPLRGLPLLYTNEPPPSLRLAINLQAFAVLTLFLMGLLAALSLVARRRRATGEEREQIRWFAYGGILLVVSVVVSVVTNTNAIGIVGMLCLPTAATIAILKYRLYDIDVVINKTVVYGVLAAFFTAVYVAVVVGIGSAFGSRSSRPLTILAAVVQRPTRCSRNSAGGWPPRIRRRTSFPGWPRSWPAARGRAWPGCGFGRATGSTWRPHGRRRRAGRTSYRSRDRSSRHSRTASERSRSSIRASSSARSA